jgi:hypothetical protein
MGRNLRLGAAVASVLVLASVAVASATSSGDNRSTDADHRKVVVLDLAGQIVESTTPPEDNFRQGDQATFKSDLFLKGTKVGEESNVCTITRGAPGEAVTLYCSGVDSLPAGQIAWQGTIDYGPNESPKADPYVLAITGGTGKYRTAHGEIRVQELTPEELRYSMRIIL